jgi:peptide/nickel transport system permease protein
MSYKTSYFHAIFWQRFRHNRFAMAGAFVVVGLFLISFLAPFITPCPAPAIVSPLDGHR